METKSVEIELTEEELAELLRDLPYILAELMREVAETINKYPKMDSV